MEKNKWFISLTQIKDSELRQLLRFLEVPILILWVEQSIPLMSKI